MKSYFAYVRVSTVKQGEHGSSLQEQTDAIKAFAARHGLIIDAWFCERETAAKVGRREFTRMLAALKKGKASGIIFHKIDRSARNLKDWSVIQDLADHGVDVRFTQEGVNLGSNEGKLTGDFLAVIASHYIRNLREEVKKGIRGRLKQGIYPLGAPIGYLDQGGGKAKIPDPIRAPYIREAFELYASGRLALRSLSDELYARGLRTKSGKKLDANRIAKMFRNPFYVGIIRMKQSGDVYPGIHEPIVSKAIFDRVQNTLDGKRNATVIVHDFLFRRMISCAICHYRLIGEKQKGHVYYRCHTKQCPTCTIREECAEAAFRLRLLPFSFQADEIVELRDMAASYFDEKTCSRDEQIKTLNLHTHNLDARLSRLMDAYIDGSIEKPLFAEKKFSLMMERKTLEEERAQIEDGQPKFMRKLDDILELLKDVPLSYESGNPSERRDFIKNITSNLTVEGKNVAIELRSPFQEVENLLAVASCGLVRDRPRTNMKKVFDLLVKHCKTETAESQSADCRTVGQPHRR